MGRVVCGSNIRQIGLGCAMYSEDNQGQLPNTDYEPKPGDRNAIPAAPQSTNIVRKDLLDAPFDGLGILFETQYLNAPQIFYCPSHHGEHPYAAYAPIWHEDQGKIVVNYQYRGSVAFSRGQTDRLTLISDCLATRRDYSHNVGSNVLRADFSVAWLSDPSGLFARTLPESEGDMNAAASVRNAWESLDHSTTSIPTGN